MKHIPHLLILLLASGGGMAADPEERVLQPTLPPTSVERVENNPAKAAVEAREAQKKDELARSAAAVPLRPEASTVAASVTRALKESNDLRTGEIVVTTEAGVIVLNGRVNTPGERELAGSIAQRAATDMPVTNRVEVRPAPDKAER